MKKIAFAVALAVAAPAAARPHHHAFHHRGRVPWCGLYMMQIKGRHDPRLARAIEWRHEGTDAGGPCIGCIIVWAHHVGELVGRTARGEWIMHSGNDGNAVRTRPISNGLLRRAVAFRRL